jgi:hypothetical protein
MLLVVPPPTFITNGGVPQTWSWRDTNANGEIMVSLSGVYYWQHYKSFHHQKILLWSILSLSQSTRVSVTQILSQVWLEMKDHNLLISTRRGQVMGIYISWAMAGKRYYLWSCNLVGAFSQKCGPPKVGKRFHFNYASLLFPDLHCNNQGGWVLRGVPLKVWFKKQVSMWPGGKHAVLLLHTCLCFLMKRSWP